MRSALSPEWLLFVVVVVAVVVLLAIREYMVAILRFLLTRH